MIDKNGMSMFVITHKPINVKIKEQGYHYLAVGKQLQNIELSDITGMSIADRNSFYCELTGLYWIWKNVDDKEIGLCHYRRFFCEAVDNQYFPMSVTKLSTTLREGDIILPKKVNVYMDYLTYYEKCLRNDALRQCCRFLIEKDQKYKIVIQNLLKANGYYCYNMLYASKAIVNQYCGWLFPLLFEFEQLINMKGWSQQQQRVFGYLSEFLLNVWVKASNLRVIEVPVSQTEYFPAALSTDASVIRLSLLKKAAYRLLPYFWPILSKFLVTNSLDE